MQLAVCPTPGADDCYGMSKRLRTCNGGAYVSGLTKSCAQDERLQMAISNPGLRQPLFASKPDASSGSARGIDTVAKNFSQLGFGSPVP